MAQLDLPIRHRSAGSLELVACQPYRCRMTVAACIARQMAHPAKAVKQARRERHRLGRPATMCEGGQCWDGACRLADAGIWRWERCCAHGCARCRGTGRVPMPRD